MKYWRLEVSFPLKREMMERETAKAVEAVGMPLADAGAGFGMRDVGWVFEDETAAREATVRALQAGFSTVQLIEHERDG